MSETLKLKDLSYEAVCAIIAQVVHASNRQYVEAIGGCAVNPSWEGIPEERRQALIKAVCKTIFDPQTPEAAHDDWCESMKAQGYTLGKVLDRTRKIHPGLVRFNELPFEEQLKDALFLGITSIFASALGLVSSTPEAAEVDTIDEVTEGPDPGAVTVGEAAEAAQEKLDDIPAGQGPNSEFDPDNLQDPEIDSGPAKTPDGAPISGFDPDNPPPEGALDPLETAANIAGAILGDRELPLDPDETKLAVEPDPDETKPAVAPENERIQSLIGEGEDKQEPAQAPLPDNATPADVQEPEDKQPAKAKTAKPKPQKKK